MPVIKLEEEDPKIVKALLDYLYTSIYKGGQNTSFH